ncbi:hypothetical protein D9M71_163210 [compost metagenome]
MQEGRRRADPAAVLDGVGVVTHAFLMLAVEVLQHRQAHLLPGADHRLAQRIAELAGADVQRAAGAAQFVSAQLVVLDGAEGLLHCRPAPFRPGLVFPALVVLRLTTHVDHPVDRAGAADDLATHPGFRRLGVREARLLHREMPGVLRVAHQFRDTLGHLHQRAAVPVAGFQQQHLLAWIGGQAVGQHAAGRTGANDDVVEWGHVSSPSGQVRAVEKLARSAAPAARPQPPPAPAGRPASAWRPAFRQQPDRAPARPGAGFRDRATS